MNNAKIVILQTRVDSIQRENASLVCEKLGLNLTDAVRMFINTIARTGSIPLSLKLDIVTINTLNSNKANEETIIMKKSELKSIKNGLKDLKDGKITKSMTIDEAIRFLDEL